MSPTKGIPVFLNGSVMTEPPLVRSRSYARSPCLSVFVFGVSTRLVDRPPGMNADRAMISVEICLPQRPDESNRGYVAKLPPFLCLILRLRRYTSPVNGNLSLRLHANAAGWSRGEGKPHNDHQSVDAFSARPKPAKKRKGLR